MSGNAVCVKPTSGVLENVDLEFEICCRSEVIFTFGLVAAIINRYSVASSDLGIVISWSDVVKKCTAVIIVVPSRAIHNFFTPGLSSCPYTLVWEPNNDDHVVFPFKR